MQGLSLFFQPFSQELSEMWNWSDDEDSESLDEHYHTIAGNSRKGKPLATPVQYLRNHLNKSTVRVHARKKYTRRRCGEILLNPIPCAVLIVTAIHGRYMAAATAVYRP